MRKSAILIGIAAIVLAVGILLLARPSEPLETAKPEVSDMQSAQPEASGTQPSAGADISVGATTTIGAERTFTVTGKNYSFAPSAITVKKGDTVTIVFKNGGGFHDLTLDQFSVATPRIQAGGQATISFVASRAGSFEYYCSVGNHRAMGMKGTLTVQE